jgi:hypothetical protein
MALKRSDIFEYFLQSKGKAVNTQIIFGKSQKFSSCMGKKCAYCLIFVEILQQSGSIYKIIIFFNII